MINNINVGIGINKANGPCHDREMFFNYNCNKVIVSTQVNGIICTHTEILNSSSVFIGKDGVIEVYKGHNNSVMFNLLSYQDFDIDIKTATTLENGGVIHVTLNTIVRENEIFKERV